MNSVFFHTFLLSIIIIIIIIIIIMKINDKMLTLSIIEVKLMLTGYITCVYFLSYIYIYAMNDRTTFNGAKYQ